MIGAAALALALQPGPPAPVTRLQQPIIIPLPPRPGDPPDPVELAAAERLVDLMLFPGSLVSLMAPRINALAADPGFPPPGADAAAQAAHRRELARRQAEDPHYLRRARMEATIRRQELSSAYARAEPALRRALARYYERTLPLSDIEAAANFFSTHEGIRFLTATLSFRGSPGYREAMAAVEPELAAAEQRIARRVAAAIASIPPPPAPRRRRR